MTIEGSNRTNLKLVSVNNQNFHHFKELVKQQAQHHQCSYSGDDDVFLNEIENSTSPVHVLMAWCNDSNMPMGYVLYHIMDSLKGEDIYLEDILVANSFRRQGVGDFLFQKLKNIAQDARAHSIS